MPCMIFRPSTLTRSGSSRYGEPRFRWILLLMAASSASTSTLTSALWPYHCNFCRFFIFTTSRVPGQPKYRPLRKPANTPARRAVRRRKLFYTGTKRQEEMMKVNDRVPLKRTAVLADRAVPAVEEFSEGNNVPVSLE